MRKFLFILIIPTLILSACQKGWYVDDDPEAGIRQKAISYYLPENQVHFTIEFVKYHFAPGPYAEYANHYLTLRNIESEEKNYYAVNNVKCQTNYMPDPDRKFWVVPDNAMPVLSYGRQGVLAGINVSDVMYTHDMAEPVFLPEKVDNPAKPDFINLQIDKSKYEVIDTTYRIVQKDSVIKRIPVYTTKEKEKTFAQKAKDAADFIIRIRKNRFSLEAALEEQYVSGVDIAFMINKLEELEQSYLELFIGKLKTDTVELHYTITPEKKQDVQRFVLDYLHRSKAVSVEQQNNADKLELLIIPLSGDSMETQSTTKKESKNALAYYHARPVEYALFLNDKKIFSQQGVIPQMGKLKYVPADIVNKDTQIKLDPTTGELIFIK